jgi:hypothetical protein
VNVTWAPFRVVKLTLVPFRDEALVDPAERFERAIDAVDVAGVHFELPESCRLKRTLSPTTTASKKSAHDLITVDSGQPMETGLPGWPCRIRTGESVRALCNWYCVTTSPGSRRKPGGGDASRASCAIYSFAKSRS